MRETLGLGKRTKYINISAITEPKRMSFLGTSFGDVEKVLSSLYGPLPMKLSKEKHMDAIHAMAIVTGSNGDCWKEIESALNQYGTIELSVEE